jgi:hypothetical protein
MAYPARYSSHHFDGDQSLHLVKDELQDSLAESQLDELTSKRDERVALIQDSCPNYAKMDHFAVDKQPE